MVISAFSSDDASNRSHGERVILFRSLVLLLRLIPLDLDAGGRRDGSGRGTAEEEDVSEIWWIVCRFQRGLKRKPMALIKKLRKAVRPCLNNNVQKKDAPPGEKPEPVRTHLRNMIIVPEMIGSIIGVYNGKTFNQVEIKPEMIGHYLAEFSISYKPVKHGRPGIGATHSSRFIPLK
ncbi:hypothetical protein GW17_00041397 [Ensete ventricosum]|nr:hypothetical protein GW17_00041397 [Ensete ventricosum]RZR85730.1 hypothetical protein BHM03_00012772 [Ensete ventricosum]